MKALLLTAAAIAAFGSGAPALSAGNAPAKSHKTSARAGVVTDGIRMYVVDYVPRMIVGESNDIRVTLTNERTGNTGMRANGPLEGFYPIVRDAKGIRLKPNADGRRFMVLIDNSKVQLVPGQRYDQDIDLNQIFDLRKPGKYTVKVTHDIDTRDGLKEETGTSNTVTIDVVTSWESKS